MTIADAAILAARKACEEKTSLETTASQEATPSEKTVITPVTSDFEKEQKIEETTEDTRNLRREKEQSFPGSYSCYHFDCLHHRWHILVFAIR